jgi:hypothetical protein
MLELPYVMMHLHPHSVWFIDVVIFVFYSFITSVILGDYEQVKVQ